MLTLTRKVDERIVITLEDGRRILVELRQIRGNQARIGVHADETIDIKREEILDDPR